MSLRSVIEDVLQEQGVVHPDGMVSHWFVDTSPCGYQGCGLIHRNVRGEDRNPSVLVDALSAAVAKHLTGIVENAIARQ